jgi:hypothetical protein
VWLNPPYGRGMERWVRKMVEHRDGLMLTMVRTDTAWWQLAAEEADAVCFLRGRVKFVPGREVAPGKRSPTDRPGASNALFAFGIDNVLALREADLGVLFIAPRAWRAA